MILFCTKKDRDTPIFGVPRPFFHSKAAGSVNRRTRSEAHFKDFGVFVGLPTRALRQYAKMRQPCGKFSLPDCSVTNFHFVYENFPSRLRRRYRPWISHGCLVQRTRFIAVNATKRNIYTNLNILPRFSPKVKRKNEILRFFKIMLVYEYIFSIIRFAVICA